MFILQQTKSSDLKSDQKPNSCAIQKELKHRN
jgi:hypothetical protein